ncbi:hypothetical protein D3C81_1611610 [compost metagenome]
MQEGNPDGESISPLAVSKKDPHLAVFYRGDRTAGGVCQQGQLGRGLVGYPGLQPPRPAQRHWSGHRQLSAVRLL